MHRVAAYKQDASTNHETESQDAQLHDTEKSGRSEHALEQHADKTGRTCHSEHGDGDACLSTNNTQNGMNMQSHDGMGVDVSTSEAPCVDPRSPGENSIASKYEDREDVACDGHEDVACDDHEDVACDGHEDVACDGHEDVIRALGGLLMRLLRDEGIVKLGYGMGYDINKVYAWAVYYVVCMYVCMYVCMHVLYIMLYVCMYISMHVLPKLELA